MFIAVKISSQEKARNTTYNFISMKTLEVERSLSCRAQYLQYDKGYLFVAFFFPCGSGEIGFFQGPVSSIWQRPPVCIEERESGSDPGRGVWNISTRHTHQTVHKLSHDFSSQFQLRCHEQSRFEIARLRFKMLERNGGRSITSSSHYDRPGMSSKGDADERNSHCVSEQ